MNCQQIQNLMPLYAGGDLEASRARIVAAHVQSCETCSVAARDYRETRQLLQTFVPPTFTEDFYAEMRQSVWQNIEKKSTSPAFSNIVSDLFRPRLAWAVATTLLIALSVVGIYVISRRSAVPQPVVSHQPPKNHKTQPDDQPATSSQNATSTAPSASSSNSKRASVHQADSRQKGKTIQERTNVAAVSAVATVSPGAISAPARDLRQIANGSSYASPAPLRMEIQTKNPNIRIIWFAPGDTKQLSPNSKGT
jgi:anti-sigma factor RsiW